MEQYRQQQNLQQQQKTKQKQYNFEQKDSGHKVCFMCGYKNEINAKFCEECGAGLSGEQKYPNCNSDVYEGADICEVCGEWLLKGKCKFCYAELKGNEKYCEECGNPTEGIVCSTCGTHNFFDFCKKCNTPLTEAALEEIENVNSNPFFQNIFNLCEEVYNLDTNEEQNLAELQQQIIVAERKIAEEQKRFEEAENKEKQVQKMIKLEQFFNKSNTEERKVTKNEPTITKRFISDDHLKMIERAKQNITGYRQRIVAKDNKQREMQAELNKMAQLTFCTGQEARRFFNAAKPKLYPDKPKKYLWECNFVHYKHHGPHECSQPQLGGQWVVDD
ncbi:MAG: hypothetical protein V1773_19695 [bacterium]